MKKVLGWAVTIAVLLGAGAGVVFLYKEARKERDKEAEREKPIEPPSRVSRSKDGEVLLAFEPEERKRLGILTAVLEEKTEPPEVVSYGRVLTPGPLLAIENDRAAALVALTTSKAEFERTKTLFQDNENASRKALEAAQAQFRADENRLRSIERQAAAEWGEVVTSIAPEARDSFFDKLAKRDIVLARTSVLPTETLAETPKSARVALSGKEDVFVSTALIYSSPQIDPRAQGRGFILRIDGAGAAFGPGAAVTAYLRLAGDPKKGVEIPRAAIVRMTGMNWVFVLTDPGHFTRRRVELERATKDGWFTLGGIAPKTEIAVERVETLLSEELKGQIHASD